MSTKTIIIKAGETIILPKGASVKSLVLDGSISVTSSCNDLPTPSVYKCGYFQMILDADDNDGHSMDVQTKYVSVKIGDDIYNIDEPVMYGDGNYPSSTPIANLNVHIPDQALFSFKAIRVAEVTSRMYQRVYFKTPSYLFDKVKLQIDNRGEGYVYWLDPIEHACDDYPDPS